MDSEIPIACALPPDGFTARMGLIDGLAADALIDRTPTARGVRVRLRDTPGVERGARALVAAESECCPFLEFTLGRAHGALVLDIAGPEDARPLIARFFAATPACARG